jgi:hypothetical protein
MKRAFDRSDREEKRKHAKRTFSLRTVMGSRLSERKAKDGPPTPDELSKFAAQIEI